MGWKKNEREDKIPLVEEEVNENYGAIKSSEKQKKEREHVAKISFSHLFKYATTFDIILMVTGTIFAIFTGACLPIIGFYFGGMTNVFVEQATHGLLPNDVAAELRSSAFANATPTKINVQQKTVPIYTANESANLQMTETEFEQILNKYFIIYAVIGTLIMISSFFQTMFWEYVSEHQVHTIRKIYFAQILHQEINWYDENDEGNLPNKLADDLERIREGTGHKFVMIIQYFSTFVSGIVVGLYVNVQMTLVTLCVGPFLIGLTAYTAKFASQHVAREQKKYAKAGAIAEETLTNIKTVTAYSGQPIETERYFEALEEGRIFAQKRYNNLTVSFGFTFFLMYAAYGLGFWYGAGEVEQGLTSPGSVFTVFFSVIVGAFSIGNALPFLNIVAASVGASASVEEIINRQVNIDPYSNKGRKPVRLNGHIEFRDVHFSYPSRPTVKVLNGLSIDIQPGKTTAIVGSSGAGKSTIVSLIQRFYDPSSGQVYLDDIPLTELNVRWLRSRFGLVSQEPVLFGVSIAENISYGRENVSREEVEEAAKQANVHDFIMTLPETYDTLVGDTGSQLSGGQKQRIAIARALVRDPNILLLDEATSALDAHSEGIVQETLTKVMVGRTTVIIAHRLSTIRNADVIHVLQEGKLFESGTHVELMEKQSLYYSLVMAQINATEDSSSNDDSPSDSQSMSTDHSDDEFDQHVQSRNIETVIEENEDEVTGETDSDQTVIPVEKEITILEVLMLQKPEWGWLLMGFIGSVGVGLVSPIFALFYGEIFEVFTLRGEALERARIFWTYLFAGLAVFCGVVYSFQCKGMTEASERMLKRMRGKVFGNILCQPMGWFDLDTSAPGVLVNRLARNIPLIKAAAGFRIGQVLSAVSTIIAAFSIAFLSDWKLSLILAIFVPIIVYTSYKQIILLKKNQMQDALAMDMAGKVASETVRHIRTVQSLGQEKLFTEIYSNHLIGPYNEAKKQAILYALLYALMQGAILYMYAVAFRVGGYLVEIHEVKTSIIYRVFFALSLCATSVGQSFMYLQDWNKARHATRILNYLLTRKSEIDPTNPSGVRPDVKGTVEFKRVQFVYPTRPDIRVLRDLSFKIEAGKTLALVGESGCGKSTVISLLERFYDPISGVILLDGYDIRTINLDYLRQHIGVVNQEPILFDCSIKDNIAYGALALKTFVDFEDIQKAARIANIDDFVMSLPQRYDTMVGERGVQLSGGQKQRVAIARALIRDPKILLLDEATSALDTENEKIVQTALDRAKEGRTCIVVAHRLSTIQNADLICVVSRGEIVEKGTHDDLMEAKGHYFELTQRQIL
ncbi:hypothetical protein V9T40_008404 [Parthenolecanium corni]|uniref:ABC-type xenobiotic transporter n=1 Tax=Parthenolecanium corni TaxID=536013 RepID=A0AAN9Y5W9_9HEMI